jgi:hypothetical protein
MEIGSRGGREEMGKFGQPGDTYVVDVLLFDMWLEHKEWKMPLCCTFTFNLQLLADKKPGHTDTQTDRWHFHISQILLVVDDTNNCS